MNADPDIIRIIVTYSITYKSSNSHKHFVYYDCTIFDHSVKISHYYIPYVAENWINISTFWDRHLSNLLQDLWSLAPYYMIYYQ